MSGYIASLLAKEKQTLTSTIERLENASGQNDVDARFTSELIIKSRRKIRELGLDPEDTTAEELHQALLSLAALHDKFLSKRIGCNDQTKTSDRLARITKLANILSKRKSIWAIKHSVAKRLLKQTPPKLLMKQLGYRSVDSMIKREDISNLFAGAMITEDGNWVKSLYKSYSKLSPSDFEARKLNVNFISKNKWQKVATNFTRNRRSNVISVKELGSVVIMPLPVEDFKGVTIMVLPLVLHYLNEIQIYSSYFKYEQVQPRFGQIVGDTLTNGYSNCVNMCGQDLHWGIVHDHFLNMVKDTDPENIEPHIQLEDLQNVSVEESLYKIEPALHFWYGTNSLGMPFGSQIVSFNLMDVATDFVNNIRVAGGNHHYLQTTLWDELMKRYLMQPPLKNQVLQQINNDQPDLDYADGIVNGVAFA